MLQDEFVIQRSLLAAARLHGLWGRGAAEYLAGGKG